MNEMGDREQHAQQVGLFYCALGALLGTLSLQGLSLRCAAVWEAQDLSAGLGSHC